MSKGLLIRPPWIHLILQGIKTWEMRSTDTRYRGPILLIEAGAGLVLGKAELVGTRKILPEERAATQSCHQVSELTLLDRWCYAWQLEHAHAFLVPKPYSHPRGAVIWVNLPDSFCSEDDISVSP